MCSSCRGSIVPRGRFPCSLNAISSISIDARQVVGSVIVLLVVDANSRPGRKRSGFLRDTTDPQRIVDGVPPLF